MAKQVSPRRVIGFIFGLWRISPYLTWLMILAQVLFAILGSTIAPIFLSKLMTNVASGSATMNNSVGLLVGYVLILLIGDVIAMRLTIALAFITESKMQAVVASKILEHLTAKSLGYHSNRMSGGTVSDANKMVGSIERFWDTLVFNIIPIFFTVISVCVALCFVLWQFAVILFILSIIITAIIIRAQISIVPISENVSNKQSAMTAHLADVINNITTVKAFGKEKAELIQYNKRIKQWRSANLKEMKSVLMITGTFSILMTILNICAFIVAILATEYHIANVGIVYLVITYVLNVVRQLWSITNTTRSYVRIIGDASPMMAALDEDIEIKDIEIPLKSTIKNGKIDFNKMSFAHSQDKKALFKDFTLNISPGERIGLVGRSGAGKTSLTKLILRFNDLGSGKILIDNQNIADISQKDLRESIAYVSQEPALFHRTIRENISYSRPTASEAEIRLAARQANALEFIETSPKGFNTVVGERGVKLSGGQRQRIAIARAILKNAPILVLDEATSALDSESEKLIQDALAKLMKDRTSIVIAHRLSTIAKLDRIIVLDKGKIIEQGSHNELLSQNGIYAKLWSHQSGGFLEE